jgi:2-oxoglutarate ferredoxin oxidoreductase subunit gamma
MQNDVIMAGFGGQGILLIGKILAYAGMNEGKEVSWMPSYGPEMRGGTCNCTVVISDRPVGSPVIQSPRAVLAMNLPSLDKFEPDIKSGGVLLVNSSLIKRQPVRDDVTVIMVPANEIAHELGSPRSANMVALGAYIGATNAVSLEEVERILEENYAAKPKLVEVNVEALRRGHAIGSGTAPTDKVPGEEASAREASAKEGAV